MPSQVKNPINLAQELGNIVLNNNIPNSYYNDEHYVSCKTADFNKAYKKLEKIKSINQKDLDSRYVGVDEEGDEITYSGIEIIKLVLTGDFGNQLKTTSSDKLNYDVALSTWKAMCHGLGEEETKKLWQDKSPESPESQDNSPYNGKSDYQKRYLSKKSLAEIVGHHMRWDDFNTNDLPLKSAKKIAVKLQDMPDFIEATKLFSYNGVTSVIKRAEEQGDPEEAEKIRASALEAAKAAKHLDFKKAQEIDNYELRGATINYIITGRCKDEFFNKLLNQVPSPKEIIKKNLEEKEEVEL